MKKLLLHTCCAPCLTSVFEQLKSDFSISVFWYNPNIYPKEEYQKRLAELKRYAKIIKVDVLSTKTESYDSDWYSWNLLTKNFANEKEGGKRCDLCIKYRLLTTAKFASENGYDTFATTLSVSPHKDTEKINKIGSDLQKDFLDIKFLNYNFKKNNGFKRSIEICKEYKIYRQKYCGCQFSIN